MKYTFKTRPYAHQVAAIKQTLEGFRKNGSYALLMAPRTGKTKSAIDVASIVHEMGKCDRVLVLCPVSVIGVWEDEIAAHCPVPYRIIVWDKRGRKTSGLPTLPGKLTIVIMNYEAFSTPGARMRNGKRSRKRGGRFDVYNRVARWAPHLIILDESHRIKTPSARKTRMIWKLGPVADYRLILTGTVLTKKKRIFDIYSQWKFLNPRSPLIADHTLGSFKQEYGVWTSRNGYPQWLRNRNMVRLRKQLHAEAFAITRDECFDLPPRREQIIPVELTGHNAELYDEMAEEMVAKIKTGEITEASIKLVQTLRLSQLTSGIAKTTPTPDHPEARLLRVGRDKLRVLEEYLGDLFEADEKVVVGARWRPDIAAIANLTRTKSKASPLYKVPTFQIHGGIPARTRIPEQVKPFNQTDGRALFIMQPQAGGLGIDLSAASIFIWFSLTNSWVDYTQSEDRIALSNKSTIFMYLICRGTVDQVLYDTLQEDGDIAKAVTDSPDRLLRNFKQTWEPKKRAATKV
jgi:SNF2 family DNA or RNA helicase